MGGDHGPAEAVAAAVIWAAEHPADRLILAGDADTIHSLAPTRPPNMEVVHAGQVIGMDEHPALALREKRDASILVACDLVRNGGADAVVSAGHTGAAMAAAVLRIGRLPGVDRPALAVQMITDAGPFVLLDIGANPDSTAENLAQYARMGAIFAERVLGVRDPRVALLSIGEEKGKGDARIQRATELLDGSGLRFVGNVEGRDVMSDHADVVVADGFTGNVVLKLAESVVGHIAQSFRREIGSSLQAKLGALLLKPAFGHMKKQFDYAEYGGAPLLGVDGVIFIGHGRSSPRAIRSAIRSTCMFVEQRVNEHIPQLLRNVHAEA
jgi:glycerol-3-phosphate acyltransferase PlsX